MARPPTILLLLTLLIPALSPAAATSAAAAQNGGAGHLRVGAAAEVITPPAGAPMAGGYSPRAMEGVHDNLYAKAIVIEQGGVKVALVVCDLLGMPRPVAEGARALIAADPGIPAGHVMISGTHTHTGPIVPNNSARDPAEGDAAEQANAYAKALPELIARSVRAADAKLAPARARTATGHEDELSFNRRFVMTDGTVAWNPGKLNPKIVRPAGPIDPAVPVVCFEPVGGGGAPLATYVNFAMHLDTTGGRRISADFPHALADVLGRVMGPEMLTVFATGACGDVNHLDVRSPDPQSSPAEARRIGTVLAGEVVKTTARLRPVAPGPLRAANTVVPLPIPQLEPGEFERAREVFLKVGKERTAFIDRVQAFKVLDVAARKGKPLEAEVQVVALGDDLAWVALPGEMFVELGLAVKQRSPFRQTIVVELANGYLGYVPTRRAYAEGAYEVVSARCAEGAGERLVDTAVRLLHELKPAAATPATAPTTAPATTRATAVTLPDKPRLHLYLMMGQSNMAGRGAVGEEDRTPHPRVLTFTADGRWEPAVEPITRDRKGGLGVGPGLAFGKAMAERDPGVTIGLIPCAVGGTPLSRWQKGGDLYANAVRRAKLAAEVGTLKGVLWHQGENDAVEEERAKSYGDRLARAVRDLRADLGAPELPFVAGQLGEFLYTRSGNKSPFARTVNEALAALPAALPHSACVPSAGLGHKGDELHFDAAAERELGRRFAAEMIRLQTRPGE